MKRTLKVFQQGNQTYRVIINQMGVPLVQQSTGGDCWVTVRVATKNDLIVNKSSSILNV